MINKKHTVFGRFEEASEKFSNNTAISHGEIRCTYGELKDRCNYFSGCLDLESNIIATWLSPGLNLVAIALAIFQREKIYMPLSSDLGNNRINDVFSTTDCKVIVTDDENKEVCIQTLKTLNLDVDYVFIVSGGEMYLCDKNGNEARPLKAQSLEQYPDLVKDESYIFYTSGTSGSGKAILGSHKALMHFLDWEIKTFEICEGYNTSLLSNITFDASLRDMFIPLTSGGTLCIPPKNVKENLSGLASWIDEQGISMIHCVPSIFRLLLKEYEEWPPGDKLRWLKHILMAGEVLYNSDFHRWQQCIGKHVELVNLYGTSETTLAKTFHRIEAVSEKSSASIHVGQPIDDAFIAIINNNKLCKIGEIGEVYIKTPYMTKGYYNNENLNKKVFVQNPLTDQKDLLHKTGDLGRYLPARDIEILGRTDSQVKVNGIRVELEEIEQAIYSFNSIESAVAVPYTSKDNQIVLIAYYVGRGVDEEKLKSHLRSDLSDSLVPAYFKKMEELPLNVNGKIDKKALPGLEEIIGGDINEYEAPATEIERSLELIWKDVLGIKKISRKSSFFDVGGTSLRCLQAISKIYKKFGVLVKVSEFFDKPSIMVLADHIEKEKIVDFKTIPLATTRDYYDLSHAQRRIWILDQVATESRAYNVPNAFKLKGELDVEVFKQSIKTLISRHESLRTIFITVDTVPKQVIKDDISFEVDFLDLRGYKEKEAEIDNCLKTELLHRFKLEKGPLVRAKLLQTNDREFVFLFTLHHIISDGWSIDVLTDELFSLYDYYSGGGTKMLEDLKLQYKDYAEWLKCEEKTSTLTSHKDYWAGKLYRLNSDDTITPDYPRLDKITYEAKTQSHVIDNKLREKIKAYCKLNNVSQYMFFHAIWLVVIYGKSKMNDIVLGSPVAGRNHPSLQNQVGLFMNMMLLRTQFEKGDRFSELLQNVRKSTIDGLDHSEYPFDLIIKELNINTEVNRNPVYDIGYTYIDELESNQRENSNFKNVNIEYMTTKFEFIKADLWFKILDLSEELMIDISYNINLFKDLTINRMLSEVNFLIEQAIESPNLSIDELHELVNKNMQTIKLQNKKSTKEKNLGLLREMMI
ncbi:MAG: mycobactin peptide synthetase MbtE [Cyclobacteriaceae bacterium]|jgi:mycobactin peptide synthetase MbtE